MSRRPPRAAIVFFCALSTALTGLGWAAGGGLAASAKVRSLTNRVVDRLDPSPAQASRLLELAQEAAARTERYRQELTALAAEQLPAFQALYAEAVRNVGLTPEVERQVKRLTRREHDLEKRYLEEIAIYAAQAREALSPEQVTAIEQMRDAVGKRGDRPSQRLMQPRSGANSRSGTNPRFGTRPRAGARGPQDGREARILGELRELRQSKNGDPGALGMLLMSPYLVAALGGSPASARAAGDRDEVAVDLAPGAPGRGRPFPFEPRAAMPAELLSLRRDITLVNLINGLNLTPRQIDQVLAANRQDDAAGAVRRIMDVLDEPQIEVLADFGPCLVPPQRLGDPVRVGQATDHGRVKDFLRRTYHIPEERWELVRGRVIDRALARREDNSGKLDPQQREETFDRLSGVVERARALDEVDLELELDALVAELASLDRRETLEKQLTALRGGPRANASHKASTFLLDPRTAPLLAQRRDFLAAAAPEGPTDLTNIAPAETCRKGACAVRRRASSEQ